VAHAAPHGASLQAEDVPRRRSDADGFYRSYVENCERLGIMPIPWIEAQALMAEWSTAFAVGRKTPPTYQ